MWWKLWLKAFASNCGFVCGIGIVCDYISNFDASSSEPWILLELSVELCRAPVELTTASRHRGLAAGWIRSTLPGLWVSYVGRAPLPVCGRRQWAGDHLGQLSSPPHLAGDGAVVRAAGCTLGAGAEELWLHPAVVWAASRGWPSLLPPWCTAIMMWFISDSNWFWVVLVFSW